MRNRLFFLFVILLDYTSLAQQFKVSLGSAFTDYKFINELSEDVPDIQPAAGISTQLTFHIASLWDNKKNKTFNLEQGRPYVLRPSVSKFLSKLNCDAGINYLQMNALGHILKKDFSYQTDNIGVQLKLGMRIGLPLNSSVNLQGVLGAQKMISGNQFVNNHIFQLLNDPQFSAFQFLSGFSIDVEQAFSNRFIGFLSYQQAQTMKNIAPDLTILQFRPIIYSVGFRLSN